MVQDGQRDVPRQSHLVRAVIRRHPVRLLDVRQTLGVRRSRDEHRPEQIPDVLALRQAHPVHPGRCASDASGVVHPEAADVSPEHLVPAAVAAQR